MDSVMIALGHVDFATGFSFAAPILIVGTFLSRSKVS